MGYVIDTTEKENINLAPGTVEEEVIQNLWFLYSSLEYDVPLDRALGLNATYIDKPIEAAKALATTEITNIDFKADYERGILKPIVEVEINGEYEKEEYTE